jgi:hypothetical protein
MSQIWYLYISNISAEFCALLCVACLIAGQHAWLISVDCEQKPLGLHQPDLQLLEVFWRLLLHRCSQSDQTILATCGLKFLLVIPFEIPYKIVFAL